MSEKETLLFVPFVPFLIGGNGDISMTNIETIFILLLPLTPSNLFFNLNG